jgi:hypothetical protein
VEKEYCMVTHTQNWDVLIYHDTAANDSIRDLYYRHSHGFYSGTHWEELSLKGYPTVIVEVLQSQPREGPASHSCTLKLGADDVTLITIHVNAYDQGAGPWKDNACGAARKVTESVIDNLRK